MLTVAISASEHVGEDLAPERAGRAAARRPDLVGRRHPGGDHQVEAVAQPERDALEHRPGQVPPVVGDGQPDERAAGERVGVRAALAGEVGQEQQAVAAGRHVAGRRDEVARTSTPGASASRNQRRLPAAESITDIMCQRPGTAWQNAWTRPAGSNSGRSVVAKTTPDVPSDSATTPGVDRADADRVRRLVAAAGDDRRAGPKPGRRRPPRP